MPYKEIVVCILCASNELVQDYRSTGGEIAALKTGCHCANCGVRYVFNVKVKDATN